jgi:hypothetical protein
MMQVLALDLQSALLRGADAAAGALGWLDRKFDPDELIAAARRETGLQDFGDAPFREPLDRLLQACAGEASLSVVGRVAINWDIGRFLANLLLMEQAEIRAPDIAAEPVRRPVFITGLPRSGTTFLHRLMMLDGANQVPRVWQTIYPYPQGSARQVIRKVDRQLRAFERLAPDFHAMHPIDATSPQECSEIQAHIFSSLRFDTTYRIPGYRRWLDRTGHLDAYRFHKRFLQHLQHRAAAPRWVLKCPDHVFALDALRAAYPDAQLVFVHRDPLKVLPSVARLTEVLRRPFTRQLDRLEIGRQESDRWLEGTRNMIRAADAAGQSIQHVRYGDLVADPLGTVETLYARLGLDFRRETADAIRSLNSAEPNGGYGDNRYSAGDYGLDLGAERERFAAYRQFFDIEPEAARLPASLPG